MDRMGKNDIAWTKIFDRYQILDMIDKNNFFEITSTQINEYREARLMTKFDHSTDLPKLFHDNELSILPNRRGKYIIGKFKAYQTVESKDIKPIVKYLPDYLQSFQARDISSESIALNIAHASGMIDHLMNTSIQDGEPKSALTLSGRMASGLIDFNIKTKIKNNLNPYMDISVENSQIEIDGGYENLHSIAILEAKNKIPADFMIRQLYYPYRLVDNLNTDKQILPVFFIYADNIFSFHVYDFLDKYDYSSIKKVNQYNFILNTTLDLSLNEVKRISEQSQMINEPHQITYPQANNFSRILDMLDYLKYPRDKFELSKAYEFDIRQSDYYGNALVYLGLADKSSDGKFMLTRLGEKINKMPNDNNRNILIIKQILTHKTFKLAFDSYLSSGGIFNKDYVSSIILEYVPTIQTIVTAERRSSTVKSWLNWIISVTSE